MSATPSRKRLSVISLVVFLLVFVCFGCIGYGVYRTWNPGPISIDIVEYEGMRTRFADIYPWAPSFLPSSIPASASNIQYEAFPYSVLQGRPYIELSFTLSPEDARVELDRLLNLNPETETPTDSVMYFTFYESGLGDKYAHGSFDPRTLTFGYSLSSD